MRHNSGKRKYRPSLEGLEARRFLSGGLLAGGAGAVVRATSFAASGAECAGIHPDGTGKGIVIITQCEIGSTIRDTGR